MLEKHIRRNMETYEHVPGVYRTLRDLRMPQEPSGPVKAGAIVTVKQTTELEVDSTGGEHTDRGATNSSVQGGKGLGSYSSRGFHITSLPLLGPQPDRKYDVIAVEQIIHKAC